MANFLSRLGNMLNPINQVRGLAQGTGALFRGDLGGAARGMSGVTTGLNMSQRGQSQAPTPKLGPAGGGPMVLEQGDKGFGAPPMPSPGMGMGGGPRMPGVQMGSGMGQPTRMIDSAAPGSTQPGEGPQPMGAEVDNARRQFQLQQMMQRRGGF